MAPPQKNQTKTYTKTVISKNTNSTRYATYNIPNYAHDPKSSTVAGTLATDSCVAVAVADTFCRKKEEIPPVVTDVFDTSCRDTLTGKAAWNLPADSTVADSRLVAARSRRFNTSRFTRMVARLVMVAISTLTI